MSWYEFVLALEKELGARIDDPEAVRFPHPERVTVREMVASIYQYLTSRQAQPGEREPGRTIG